MSIEPDLPGLAAQLIQWGLRPSRRPAQEPAYQELIRRCQDAEFRQMVREVAEGLGLLVLDVSEHGIILAPRDGSPFALKPADFRPGQRFGGDDRLIDGLVQLAIATALFPRARDLEEEASLVRQPVTVEEIEAVLRGLCQRLSEASRQAERPDPSVADEAAGLIEAWRVYKRRLPTAETKDGRKAPGTTLRIIEENLDRLCDFGCFLRQQRSGRIEYQPTYRYQVLVKELASTVVFERLRQMLSEPRPESSPSELGKDG